MGLREYIAYELLGVKPRIEQQIIPSALTPEIIRDIPEHLKDQVASTEIENTRIRKENEKLKEKIHKLESGLSTKEQEIEQHVLEQKKLKQEYDKLQRLPLILDRDVKALAHDRKPFTLGFTDLHRFELVPRDDGGYNTDIIVENPKTSEKRRIKTKQTLTSISRSLVNQAEGGVIIFDIDSNGTFMGNNGTEEEMRDMNGTLLMLQSQLKYKEQQIDDLKDRLQEESRKKAIAELDVEKFKNMNEVNISALDYQTGINEAATKQNQNLLREHSQNLLHLQSLTLNAMLTAGQNKEYEKALQEFNAFMAEHYTQDQLEDARRQGVSEAFQALEQAQLTNKKPVIDDDKTDRMEEA